MNKTEKLQSILELHSKWTENPGLFCKKGCSHCCTLNVSATSLEAELIGRKIGSSLKSKVESSMKEKRFMPETTTNTIANLALENIEPPEEELVFSEKTCPFLFDNECIIYDIRPLSCRIMLSLKDCGKIATAELDERTMTINTIFQQYVELLDHDGLSGNIIDLLVHGSNPVFISKFPANQVPRAIMIPPEYRNEMKELLLELNKIVYEKSA